MIQIRINDPRSFGSWCIKGIEESTLDKDSLVPLMHHDSTSDYGVLALVAYNQRKKRIRVENYAEVVVPQYSFDTFRSHFHMSRRALEFLEGLLAVVPGLPHEPKHGGRPPIPLQNQILCLMFNGKLRHRGRPGFVTMPWLEIPLVQLINFGSIVNGTA